LKIKNIRRVAMVILNVYIQVKPDMIEEFKKVTKENAEKSLQEPGVIRFDFLQQEDDPACFLLNEVYKNEDAVMAHKDTLHYAKWRSIAEAMMEGDRKRIRYRNIYPDNSGW
jgi:(4S)-4-hydroxy-5-phosphonooxypentane-2,3-dione isomerase